MRGRSRKTRAAYGMRALRSRVQSLASHRLAELPLVRQPGIQFAQFRLWQVHQQLREIQLRINLVPAAGAGQASQNCECATATRVADKTRPSSRIAARTLAAELGEDWREQRGWEVERWFERLPMYLLEDPKRQKVLKALSRALALAESGKL